MTSTATEAILTDEDFVVVDCTNTDDTHGLFTSVARVSTPEAWLPKAIRDNIKRLDAHKKGTGGPLQQSSSFRFTPAPALQKALDDMSTFTGNDDLYWYLLYNVVTVSPYKSRAQFRKALQFAGLGR